MIWPPNLPFLIHSYIKACFSYSLIDLFNVCTMLLNWSLHLLTPIQLFHLISVFFKSIFFLHSFSSSPKPEWMVREMQSQLLGVRALVSPLTSPFSALTILHTATMPSSCASFFHKGSHIPCFLIFLNVRTIVIVQKRFLLQFILYLQSQITPSKTFLILHEAFA